MSDINFKKKLNVSHIFIFFLLYLLIRYFITPIHSFLFEYICLASWVFGFITQTVVQVLKHPILNQSVIILITLVLILIAEVFIFP